jgi:spore coat polysaccharide biosynthesis protein SpsF
MSTAIIVQARMTSTRLPGKVLLPILSRPMLSYQLERLRRVSQADRIVIATTTNATDDPIVDFCATEGVDCTRGSEQDVLSRYFEAANRFAADTVVRVTSDCPLIDPQLIDSTISAYREEAGGCDYVSNMIEPSWPYGMAVEVFSARALAEAHAEATEEAEREHVTPFIYWRPGRYRLKSLSMQPDLSQHRWTVDTPEDFELVRRILESLYPRKPCFGMADVLALLAEHPDWAAINRHIKQKTLSPATTKK